MATSSRAHRVFRFPVIASLTAVAAAVLVPVGLEQAAASPHLSLATVQARIAVLNNQVERISESFDAAQVQLGALNRQERLTEADLARDKSALGKTEGIVARTAAQAYRSGGQLSSAMSLVTASSPQSFLDKQSSLQQVARYQAQQEAAAAAAQRTVAAAEAVRTAQVAQQRKVVSGLAAKKASVQKLLAQQNDLLSRLRAQARARLAAEQAAQQRHEEALRASAPAPATAAAPVSHSHPVAASGQAGAAVAYAYAQLGKPYVWAAAGPDSFDCSGLTMRAWEAAGVSLPHNAAMQQSDIPAVSLSDLQPGDLIFFGSPAFHVGIYVGGGNMIQAPHTGASVEVTPVSYMSPSGAGRP